MKDWESCKKGTRDDAGVRQTLFFLLTPSLAPPLPSHLFPAQGRSDLPKHGTGLIVCSWRWRRSLTHKLWMWDWIRNWTVVWGLFFVRSRLTKPALTWTTQRRYSSNGRAWKFPFYGAWPSASMVTVVDLLPSCLPVEDFRWVGVNRTRRPPVTQFGAALALVLQWHFVISQKLALIIYTFSPSRPSLMNSSLTIPDRKQSDIRKEMCIKK